MAVQRCAGAARGMETARRQTLAEVCAHLSAGVRGCARTGLDAWCL